MICPKCTSDDIVEIDRTITIFKCLFCGYESDDGSEFDVVANLEICPYCNEAYCICGDAAKQSETAWESLFEQLDSRREYFMDFPGVEEDVPDDFVW